MSYQVLARKWRPRRFADLVGQEHVVQALTNALDRGRVHHAFLFSGTRGVGKTTIARILAKALNCDAGVSSQPCGECRNCTEIDQGHFVDLIEVDAASRTKVDDTRELLENVQYAPTRGRHKVYLIDEVHMLSTHSFNALLKTLEEPPPHVKFLLATTDPQKLPVTVLSRCLQFHLKRLPVGQIETHLGQLLQAESIEYEGQALHQLAVVADGSMRDALSLLDQAIAYGGGDLKSEQVRTMLGSVEGRHLAQILTALTGGDAESLWSALQRTAQQVPDYDRALGDLAQILHRVTVKQLIPQLDHGEDRDQALIQQLAQTMDPELVQLCYDIALRGREQIDLAPDPQTGFEMTLLRMLAFQPDKSSPTEDHAPPNPGNTVTPAARTSAAQQQAEPAAAAPPLAAPEPAPNAASTAPAPSQAPQQTSESPPTAPQDWPGLVQRLGLKGAALVLASNSMLKWQAQGQYQLHLDPSLGHLHTQAAEQKVIAALSRCFGQDIKVAFKVAQVADETPAQRQTRQLDHRRAEAISAVETDPTVQALKQTFGAQVIGDSIQPSATAKPPAAE